MVGWLVGAGINLVGSIAINLGTNVMKLGHNKRAMLDMPEDEKPPVTRFREWQIGTAVFIVGNVANFVSFGYAAQSLLAALGSVQFVSNVFFASFVLKEKITMMIITATCCIIGGCLLLVLFGNHSSDDYTVDQLLALYRKPAYIVYLVMMFVFVLGSYILYLHGKHVASIKGREQSAWVAILPVTYSIFSALLGTQSVLFSKSLSVLLRTTFSGSSQLGNWYTWVTLVCFLITAGFWVTRLNKGLRLFPAMIIVPLMQICWTLFSIISGMLYFQEYTAFNPSTAKHGPLNAIMFTLGVMTVFVGVFLLTKSGQRRDDDGDEAQPGQVKDGLELTHNPAFEEQPDKPGTPPADPDVPQKDKLSMDTLRFTSLASSTAANIKTLNKAGRKSLLSSTMSPGRPSAGDSTPDYPSTPDAATAADLGATNRTLHSTMTSVKRLEPIADAGEGGSSLGSTINMMGTLKKGAKKFGHQLRKDFNVDLDDFRRMFGMGQGAYMPALSLFAMPAVDLTASSRKSKQADEQQELQKARSEAKSTRWGSVETHAAHDLPATSETISSIPAEPAQATPAALPPMPGPVLQPALTNISGLVQPGAVATRGPSAAPAQPGYALPLAPTLFPGTIAGVTSLPVAPSLAMPAVPAPTAAALEAAGSLLPLPSLPVMPSLNPVPQAARVTALGSPGSPVQPDLSQVQAIVRSAAARHFLGAPPAGPVLVSTGGGLPPGSGLLPASSTDLLLSPGLTRSDLDMPAGSGRRATVHHIPAVHHTRRSSDSFLGHPGTLRPYTTLPPAATLLAAESGSPVRIPSAHLLSAATPPAPPLLQPVLPMTVGSLLEPGASWVSPARAVPVRHVSSYHDLLLNRPVTSPSAPPHATLHSQLPIAWAPAAPPQHHHDMQLPGGLPEDRGLQSGSQGTGRSLGLVQQEGSIGVRRDGLSVPWTDWSGPAARSPGVAHRTPYPGTYVQGSQGGASSGRKARQGPNALF